MLSNAQQKESYFEVKAVPDSTDIRIGEQVTVQLSAKVQTWALKGANFKVIFPIVPDTFNHLEVIQKSDLDTSKSNENEKFFSRTITVTSFDSGSWQFPPMKFEVYSVTDGSYDSVFTEPFDINVNTVKVDTTQAFKPIKNIQSVNYGILDYIWFIVGGICLIILVIGIIHYLRTRNKKPVPVETKPKESPYERAMRSLNEMKEQKAWEQSDSKLYYTNLTNVLRIYFEQQFKISALEQTTAELLENIKPVTVLNQKKDKLRSVLTLADLAKFAKLQPGTGELESSLQTTIEIVEWTKAAVDNAAAKEAAEAQKNTNE